MLRLSVLLLAACLFVVVAGCDEGSDASMWKTYRNDLGFSIRYPPSWKVVTSEAERPAPGGAKILNEKRQQQTALEGGDSGEAWVEIIPEAFPRFDVDELFAVCGGASENETVFAGRPAVLCAGEGRDAYSDLPLEVNLYLIEFPPGHALHIATYALDTDETTRRLLAMILATASFEETP